MNPWLHLGGEVLVVPAVEGLATTNGAQSNVTGLDTIRGFRRGLVGDWMMLGAEVLGTYQVDTTTPAIDAHDLKWHSPIDVNIGSWPYNAYAQARGDAIRWMHLMRFGKIFGADFAVATSQMNSVGRTTLFLPFAGVVGAEPWDSAPHAVLMKSMALGRLDSIFTGVTVDALTYDVRFHLAQRPKTVVPRAFRFASIPAASDLESKIMEAADGLHLWFLTDSDDAFVGTDTIAQITVGGKNLLHQAIQIRTVARDVNRTLFPNGAASPALTFLNEATPELLVLVYEGFGVGRNLTPMKSLATGDSCRASYSQDVGTTIFEHSLLSFDLGAGQSYRSAAGLQGGVPSALHKAKGMQPGVPQRIVRAA